jgi:predicted nucleic-acid-binding protein
MIGIDTNVLLRLLLHDDEAQARKARREIEDIESAGTQVLINDVVLTETLWTLRGRFASDKDELLLTLRSLLGAASFAFENRGTVQQALALYEASNAGFSDCLIAAKNAGIGCEYTATFDRAMRSLPAVKLL